MVKVYIAGPITGHPDYREKFAAAEGAIRQRGFEPVNPALNKADSYKGYIDKGLEQLKDCDVIYMLRGWQMSTGARLERQYALAVCIPVCYEEDEEQ